MRDITVPGGGEVFEQKYMLYGARWDRLSQDCLIADNSKKINLLSFHNLRWLIFLVIITQC